MTRLADVFQGCIPALMTPCDQNGQPDFDALVRKGQELVALGMRAVVYCGSMGDWPLLTDGQRQEGVASLVAAGVPVVVGTGAQNPQIAAAHAHSIVQHCLSCFALDVRIGSIVQAQSHQQTADLLYQPISFDHDPNV